ncbi:MAG: dihydrodipicolinate reductase C-terminal domain-containing protein [Chlamydiales bacterium]|nr:dihydrodipicolinate reductase C-terminal domain-containing protein [Chlamydiales bacterium]
MKIVLIGYGKMGRMVEQAATQRGHEIIAICGSRHECSNGRDISEKLVAEADVCIDFSHPDIVIKHIEILTALKKTIVIGTTGWDAHLPSVSDSVAKAGVGLIHGPNFSLGVNLFYRIVANASTLLRDYDVGIMEEHHRHKADSPSGTARHIAHILQKPIDGIASARYGSVPGTHRVLFDSPVDSIVLEHTARNREGFANGAISAAEWIHGKIGVYTVDDMITDALL